MGSHLDSVTLSKFSSLSMVHFLHLENGDGDGDDDDDNDIICILELLKIT